MADSSLDELPVPQSVVLAYAPAPLRDAWQAYFTLDAQLAELVRKASEPMLGQLRLAWWRDRLQEPTAAWPKGNPLLALIERSWGVKAAELTPLVDGWEHILADPPIAPLDVDLFALGRARAMRSLAEMSGSGGAAQSVDIATKRWALADLATHIDEGEERQTVLGVAAQMGTGAARLERSMRPLAILDGLARRSLANNSAPLFSGRKAALVTLRLGIFGY